MGADLDKTADHIGDEAIDPAPGGTVGRFVVLGVLGAGGMGVVMSAYDPQLDRKVALKILRTWSGDSAEARERLAREAQAMAKLSHPNVVAVHEVGTVDDKLFVVMEQVEGQTLREHLAERRLGWREILPLFIAAGRGLEAVHRAGLVHRDFKPSNVLVGKDGRVRIADFGLVTVHENALVESRETSGPVGTPSYMAPEQLGAHDAPIDARADQFSFCVALYQALFSERPFPEGSIAELRQAVLAAKVKTPSGSEVPSWLAAVVLRGLQLEPERRYPSMSELLDALSRDPNAARRRLISRAAIASLLALVAAGAWRVEAARRNQCTGAGARLAGVWDPAVRERLRSTFLGAGAVYAADTFNRVAVTLDDYARDWTAMSEQACRATRIDGRQSDTLYDLRMACLEQRRRTLQALTTQWATGMTDKALRHAEGAAADLPSIEECANAQALTERAPMPRDPAVRAKIGAVRAELDRAHALASAVEWKPALASAQSAQKQAAEIDWPQIRAEADFRVGSVLLDNRDSTARARFESALREAAAARDDQLAALIIVEQVTLLSQSRDHANEALVLAEFADALVLRAGDPPVAHGRLLLARGNALVNLGRFSESEKAYLDARKLFVSEGPMHHDNLEATTQLQYVTVREGHYDDAKKWGEETVRTITAAAGPNDPRLASTVNNLAILYATLGEYPKSHDYFQKSYDLDEKFYGDSTPSVAVDLGNLCGIGYLEGRLAESVAWCGRSVAIGEKLHGTDSASLGSPLQNLSQVLRDQGKLDEALAAIQRSLAVREKALGPTNPTVAESLLELGLVREARGEYDAARQAFTRSLEIDVKAFGPGHADTLGPQAELARMMRRRGQIAEAQKQMESILPKLKQAVGDEHPSVAELLAELGRCALQSGQPAAAVPLLSQALTIDEKRQVRPAETGEAGYDLARAEWALGKRQESRTHTQAAERALASSESAGAQRILAELRAWRR